VAKITAIENAKNMDTSGSNHPIAGGTPLKRYGCPGEVARLMLCLASNGSSFCTRAFTWSMAACRPDA